MALDTVATTSTSRPKAVPVEAVAASCNDGAIPQWACPIQKGAVETGGNGVLPWLVSYRDDTCPETMTNILWQQD
jgi:hypothetical protein